MKLYRLGRFGFVIDIWRFSFRWHLWTSRQPEHSRNCNGMSIFCEYTPRIPS